MASDEIDVFNNNKLLEPNGVIAIHFREVKNIVLLDFADEVTVDQSELFIAVRIGRKVVDFTKSFRLHNLKSVVIDSVRHIPVRIISNNRFDIANSIRFELIHFEPNGNHLILAVKEFSLFTIIKNIHVEDTSLDFRNDDRLVAELDVEMLFAYGVFGYGYSNQVFDRYQQPADFINHSLFVRLEPPENRTDKIGVDVMVPNRQEFPRYLPLTTNDQVSRWLEELNGAQGERRTVSSDAGLKHDDKEVPTKALQRLKEPILEMLENYSKQTSRLDRLNYISSLITEVPKAGAKSGMRSNQDPNDHDWSVSSDSYSLEDATTARGVSHHVIKGVCHSVLSVLLFPFDLIGKLFRRKRLHGPNDHGNEQQHGATMEQTDSRMGEKTSSKTIDGQRKRFGMNEAMVADHIIEEDEERQEDRLKSGVSSNTRSKSGNTRGAQLSSGKLKDSVALSLPQEQEDKG